MATIFSTLIPAARKNKGDTDLPIARYLVLRQSSENHFASATM